MRNQNFSIVDALLKEHSKKQTLSIVNYIGTNPKRFKELIDLFVKGPYRVTQRASWVLSTCAEKHPNLILPHLNTILKVLKKENVHDAAKRNIVRLLQFIDIPKRYYGTVAENCFNLMDPSQPIGIRVFSMTVLGTIANHLPDLGRELQLVIEDQLPYASPGFAARAKKVLKEIKK